MCKAIFRQKFQTHLSQKKFFFLAIFVWRGIWKLVNNMYICRHLWHTGKRKYLSLWQHIVSYCSKMTTWKGTNEDILAIHSIKWSETCVYLFPKLCSKLQCQIYEKNSTPFIFIRNNCLLSILPYVIIDTFIYIFIFLVLSKQVNGRLV